MLITTNIFYKQQLLLHFAGKFHSGSLQEVMFDIPYLYGMANYSKTTSKNWNNTRRYFTKCNFFI